MNLKLKLKSTGLALAAFGLLWAVPSSADDGEREFTKSDLTEVVVRDVYPDLPKLRLDNPHRFSRVRRPPRVLREVNMPVVDSQVDNDGNLFFVFTVTDTKTRAQNPTSLTVAQGCHYPATGMTFVLDNKDKVFVSKHKDAKTVSEPCKKAEELTI